jgi:hypothetical protein
MIVRFVSMQIILVLFAVCSVSVVSAQQMIGIGTRYNDSFREWQIVTEDDDLEGELRMRWTFRNDWTQWDFRLGDSVASIEQKWKDDPNLWEIRCNGITVNARTAWPGEFTRWKLNDGHHQFNWYTKYVNQRNEWLIESNDYNYQVYTYWEGDPREWVIVDELDEDVSMAMKVAMTFLALHFSSPRI